MTLPFELHVDRSQKENNDTAKATGMVDFGCKTDTNEKLQPTEVL